MLPLHDRRVLITRARGQVSVLAGLLEAQGATPISIPTIELVPPRSFCALDAALSALRSFDWLLFTSANAVGVFSERARQLGLKPNPRRIGVIGPATARAVRESGLAPEVDLMPTTYVAESFAEALRPLAAGASMLLVRAAVARDTLPEALNAAGAVLTVADAYRTVVPQDSVHALRELLEGAPPDAVLFTSASTARNLAELLREADLRLPTGLVLASIGPITSEAMRDHGMEPSVEARESTMPALVAALVDRMGSFHC